MGEDPHLIDERSRVAREELAADIHALTEKLDVKKRAQVRKDELVVAAKQRIGLGRASGTPVAPQPAVDGAESTGTPRTELLAGAGVSVCLLGAALVVRRRRASSEPEVEAITRLRAAQAARVAEVARERGGELLARAATIAAAVAAGAGSAADGARSRIPDRVVPRRKTTAERVLEHPWLLAGFGLGIVMAAAVAYPRSRRALHDAGSTASSRAGEVRGGVRERATDVGSAMAARVGGLGTEVRGTASNTTGGTRERMGSFGSAVRERAASMRPRREATSSESTASGPTPVPPAISTNGGATPGDVPSAGVDPVTPEAIIEAGNRAGHTNV